MRNPIILIDPDGKQISNEEIFGKYIFNKELKNYENISESINEELKVSYKAMTEKIIFPITARFLVNQTVYKTAGLIGLKFITPPNIVLMVLSKILIYPDALLKHEEDFLLIHKLEKEKQYEKLQELENKFKVDNKKKNITNDKSKLKEKFNLDNFELNINKYHIGLFIDTMLVGLLDILFEKIFFYMGYYFVKIISFNKLRLINLSKRKKRILEFIGFIIFIFLLFLLIKFI